VGHLPEQYPEGHCRAGMAASKIENNNLPTKLINKKEKKV
jgi:hypothetical protein